MNAMERVDAEIRADGEDPAELVTVQRRQLSRLIEMSIDLQELRTAETEAAEAAQSEARSRRRRFRFRRDTGGLAVQASVVSLAEWKRSRRPHS